VTDQITTNSNNNALETLVIAHLAAIKRHEAELQKRFRSQPLEAQNVAAEVWQLQTSAERLSRMIDAMNFGGGTAAFAA
jgi:hypothetical protein